MCFILSENGKVLWDAASNGEDDGPPFAEEDGVTFILPEGNYKVMALALYSPFNPDMDFPDVRRTFFGGGFEFESGELVEITTGDSTDIAIQMAEDGYSISGETSTFDDGFGSANIILYDDNGLLAGAYVSFFAGVFEESYTIGGCPEGEYPLLAWIDGASHYASTWYPDVGDPGRDVEHLNLPEDIDLIEVVDADIEDADIVIQSVDNIVSVPNISPVISPTDFRLYGAFPNPFNSTTMIVYYLPIGSEVSLKLFDMQGRFITTIYQGYKLAGKNGSMLKAGDYSSGTYLIRLEADGNTVANRVILLK